MKRADADRLISEKTGSLEPLEGGIVFGKEAAWDKLQARLDKKPVRVLPVRYWLAAAAVLLVMVSGMGVYYYGEKGVALKNFPAKAQAHQVEVAVAHEYAPKASQSEIRSVKTTAVIVKDKIVNSSPTSDKEEKTEANNIVTPPAPVENKAVNTVVANIPAATEQPMKVLNINDIESRNLTLNATTPVVVQTAQPDFNKMPVYYISDVEKEEVEIKSVLRESRNSIVHIPFSRPAYHGYLPDTEEYTQSHNLLKSIFKTQN